MGEKGANGTVKFSELSQEQLASRIGTKNAYISRVENGHTDVQVSTLFKIFEGLGRRISINIL